MEELQEVQVEDSLPAVLEEGEDRELVVGISLPSYADVDDKKTVGYIKDVFKGFTFDPTADFSKKFTDMNMLANYVQQSLSDIRTVRNQAEMSEVLQRGACLARFWCLGKALSKALTEGEYGTGAGQRLATQLGKSIPYVYQIKSVGERLTLTDCFLLGVRGCDTTTLRGLAQVKDDDMRKSIIKAFIDSFMEYTDEASRVKAKASLTAAINANRKAKAGYIEEANSDPATGAATVLVSDVQQEAMENIVAWKRYLAKPSTPQVTEALIRALTNFFITSSTPDAESHLTAIKGEAEQLKTVIQAVKNNLDDILIQLDSFAANEVLQDEDTEEPEDEGADQ